MMQHRPVRCVCVYVDEMHNGGSYLLEKVDKF